MPNPSPNSPIPVSFQTLSADLAESYGRHPDLVGPDIPHRIRARAVVELIDALRTLMFPGFFSRVSALTLGRTDPENPLEHLADLLHEQIVRALAYRNLSGTRDPVVLVRDFLKRLPEIRKILATDVDAAFEGDPASSGKDEIILAYPGVHAILVNRLAHELHALGIPLLPRMMTECAHGQTGIDIHPGAVIGHHFFIDHGTGVVIGETTRIGNYVRVYQGVTLGAISTRGGRRLQGLKRHPTIEDNVTIYSGASILGGETVIGAGAVIGSNVFITQSVPERTRVSLKEPELRFMTQGQDAGSEFRQESFQGDTA